MALALLMAGITTAGVKVFGWKWPIRRAKVAALPAQRTSSRDLTHDQRLVAVQPEPEPARIVATAPASAPERHLSASEMFAEAARSRSVGDTRAALAMSKKIEEFFPNSEEGVNTHLVLGLLYLEQDQAALALQEFATFRLIGPSEAKAEAYFGQAQALRKLGRSEDERTVLEELLQSYPRSAYVAAARLRLGELAPDAAR